MRRVLGARRPARRRRRPRWTALNACLLPALALDGQEVVTAEGLGNPGDLHPVQEEMACRGGSQCGYCTPGFICSMAAEYYRPERTASTQRPRRRRARPQRLRPARALGQPLPLHRLPPDPRRRLRVGQPARRRRTGRPRRGPGARRAPDPGEPVRPARPTSPTRSRCWPSTRTRWWWRAAPTGASRSTSAVSAPRSSSRWTGSPSCATFAVTDDTRRARRRAHAVRGRTAARGPRAAAGRSCGRSSRPG